METTESFDLQELWVRTLAGVVPRISSPVQREWLGDSQPVGFSEDTVIVATPHAYAREWLEGRCTDLLRETLSHEVGRPLSLMITVQPKPQPGPTPGELDDAVIDLEPEGVETLPESGATADVVTPANGGVALGDGHGGTAPRTRPANPVPEWTLDELRRDRAARDERERELLQPRTPDRSAPPARDHEPTAPWDREDPPSRRPRHDREEPGARDHLNPKYTFDAFVIGSSNRFAHAASRAVAEAPTQSYNPLFVYGGAGLGKTHLLHAIGHYVREWYPRMTVRYVPTDQFIKDFINSIQHGTTRNFQMSYRQADVLLIDDIQFIERAERTQEEFFHTFNALHMAEKQIVITSDRPPKQMAQLEDRLRSRFEWGLIVDVQPPDLETRIAILRRKAEADSAVVPDDVLELIATKVQSNIRELEGALIRVAAFASIHGQVPSTDAATAILKDLFPDDRTREINVDLIMDEISQYYSVTAEDLRSKSRRRQLTTARQIAMWFTREMTEMSLPEIGRAFGGRDHSTVLHAKNKIDALIRERAQVYDQVDELTTRIKARARGAR